MVGYASKTTLTHPTFADRSRPYLRGIDLSVAKRKPRPKPTPSPSPSMLRERDDSRPASVVFYNADLGMVSPAVSDSWPRPVQELLRESEAMFTTNFPCASCARF